MLCVYKAQAPEEVGFYDTDDYAYSVYVSDSLVYVADGLDGLRIIDVSNPSAPVEVGFYDTGDKAAGVYVSGSTAYVADGGDGLYIIRNDLATGIPEKEQPIPHIFSLKQNYPNPFNPTTTIEYILPKTVQVELAIYNMLGQKVRTLVNESQPSGNYRVQWDGRDDADRSVASGVYIYKIKANDFAQTKKMLLIR